MKNRLLSTLGICRKAGRLALGFDPVVKSAREGEAQLILLAADLSPKSAKELRYTLREKDITILDTPVTMDEIWYRLGKRAGILAVTDRGLAHTLETTVGRMIEEE